jgi:site-specific recombinase XerC
VLPNAAHILRADYAAHMLRADYAAHILRADYAAHMLRADYAAHKSQQIIILTSCSGSCCHKVVAAD